MVFIISLRCQSPSRMALASDMMVDEFSNRKNLGCWKSIFSQIAKHTMPEILKNISRLNLRIRRGAVVFGEVIHSSGGVCGSRGLYEGGAAAPGCRAKGHCSINRSPLAAGCSAGGPPRTGIRRRRRTASTSAKPQHDARSAVCQSARICTLENTLGFPPNTLY